MSSAMQPLFGLPPPLQPKKSLITKNYDITSKSLGVGINGRVLECIDNTTGEKFALKVTLPPPHCSIALILQLFVF